MRPRRKKVIVQQEREDIQKEALAISWQLHLAVAAFATFEIKIGVNYNRYKYCCYTR